MLGRLFGGKAKVSRLEDWSSRLQSSEIDQDKLDLDGIAGGGDYLRKAMLWLYQAQTTTQDYHSCVEAAVKQFSEFDAKSRLRYAVLALPRKQYFEHRLGYSIEGLKFSSFLSALIQLGLKDQPKDAQLDIQQAKICLAALATEYERLQFFNYSLESFQLVRRYVLDCPELLAEKRLKASVVDALRRIVASEPRDWSSDEPLAKRMALAAKLSEEENPVLDYMRIRADKGRKLRATLADCVGPEFWARLRHVFVIEQRDRDAGVLKPHQVSQLDSVKQLLKLNASCLSTALLGMLQFRQEHLHNIEEARFLAADLDGRLIEPIWYEFLLSRFDGVIRAITRCKLELTDDQMAGLVDRVTTTSALHDRHFLNNALRIAREHPDGSTESALLKLGSDIFKGNGHTYLIRSWALDIQGLLATDDAETLPIPDELAGTRKLSFQTVSIALAGHFSAILDKRLQEAKHLKLLQPSPPAEVSYQQPWVDEENAVRCRIAGLLAAVRPFIDQHPELSKKLSTFLAHAKKKSEPSPKWRKEAIEILAEFPNDSFQVLLTDLFKVLQTLPDTRFAEDFILKGLIWMAVSHQPILGPQLVDFAHKYCYQTIPGVGIKAEKLGNACLWALINMPDGAGIPYLSRLLTRVKYPKTRARIDAALNDAAELAGVSRAALDEMLVPTHDLDASGQLCVQFSDGHAQIAIESGLSVVVKWVNGEGKPLKAASDAMKADKESINRVKALVKEIEADLRTQIVRIQRIYLEDRNWAYPIWQERYLEHPLIGQISKSLVWKLTDSRGNKSVMWADGCLRDVSGEPAQISTDTCVELLHPIHEDVASVQAWRKLLESQQIKQPFAQVWREIYRVTDAENTTGTYSNRWAGHILKQHQFMTLARLNNWTVTHRMWVDAPNDAPAHLVIPAYRLVADFWVEGTGGDDPPVLESQAYQYVSTDRLKFSAIAEGADTKDSSYGPERGADVALDQLPAIVFSEVMRHCDLFTAVASIASDPLWLDRGAEANHPNQWHTFAGQYWRDQVNVDLSGSGLVRLEFLKTIIPKLAIGPVCAFDDRALIVKGKRHTYRIHLNSGAVTLQSEMRHICIVPASNQKQKASDIYLPFQGDQTLSLILSKAMLLADDDKITDPVILAQL